MCVCVLWVCVRSLCGCLCVWCVCSLASHHTGVVVCSAGLVDLADQVPRRRIREPEGGGVRHLDWVLRVLRVLL